jgi:hypothetical protein
VLDERGWEQTRQLLQYAEGVLQEYSRRIRHKQQGERHITALVIKKQPELHKQEVEKKRWLDLYHTGTICLEESAPRLERIREKRKRVEQEYIVLEEEPQREQHQLQLIEQFVTFQAKFVTR